MSSKEKYLKKLHDRENFLEKVEKNVQKRSNIEFPPGIVIETTAYCNMKCTHCGHSTMKREKGNMDIKLYKQIIGEIAEENPETEVWLTYYGEALILKYKLFYMIRYAKEQGLKYLVLNTNGMLLDDEMSDLIIESGLDRFIFSLDGFTKETYNSIRVHGERDVVYNNIINLYNKIKKQGLKRPLLEIQYSIMDENEDELQDFIDFWSDKDVYIKVREKLTWSGTVEANNLDKNQSRIACPWAVSNLGIFWNGNAGGCLLDYEGRNIIGNVKKEGIKGVWNGEKRKAFMKQHLEHKFDELPDFCAKCMDWQAVGAETYEGKSKKNIDWKKLILGKNTDKAKVDTKE